MIQSIYDSATEIHLKRAIVPYIKSCSQLLETIRNIELPALDETLDFKEYSSSQMNLWYQQILEPI